MRSASVPVSRDGFRVKAGDHAKVFSNAMQQVTRHPQLVSHLYTLTWTHLELPLHTQIGKYLVVWLPNIVNEKYSLIYLGIDWLTVEKIKFTDFD
jgi:hypothetical protein